MATVKRLFSGQLTKAATARASRPNIDTLFPNTIMATVYLPVEPIEGMDSAERAEALDAQVWCLRRPQSLQSPQDITKYYYPRITHPDTGQVAIVGDTTEEVRIIPEVDLTELLAPARSTASGEGRARYVHRRQPRG